MSGGEERSAGDPFRRSSLMGRSPPKSGAAVSDKVSFIRKNILDVSQSRIPAMSDGDTSSKGAGNGVSKVAHGADGASTSKIGRHCLELADGRLETSSTPTEVVGAFEPPRSLSGFGEKSPSAMSSLAKEARKPPTEGVRNQFFAEEKTSNPENKTIKVVDKAASAWHEECALAKMCDILVKEIRAAAEKQKNCSTVIKGGVLELQIHLEEMARLRSMRQPVPDKDNSCSDTIKRQASSPAQENAGKKRKAKPDDNQAIALSGNEPVAPASSWSTVVTKSGKKRAAAEKRVGIDRPNTVAAPKVHRRKNKPSAVLLKPAEGKSYADVLRQLREKVNPAESQTEIRAIRQTRSGQVLVELGSKTQSMSAFCDVVRNAVGDVAAVKGVEPTTSLEIRDLDCLTTQEEVEGAIKDLLPTVREIRVGIGRESSRMQKVAIVDVDVQSASALLELGKIKIGWVNCRIRSRVSVERCFKCLGFGHIANACKGPDRSALCRKCGKEGHVAKECTGAECCALCSDAGAPDTAHMLGSGRCSVFRTALKQGKTDQK